MRTASTVIARGRSPRSILAAFLLALLAMASCGRGPAADGAAGTAGLATDIDSTADTVFARVRGVLPASAVRRLVEELRIEAASEDTSLFTEVFEFDVAPSGRILVYDRPSNSGLLFGADGRLERRVGRQGGGPGEFNSNNGMVALADTGWAVWDSRTARISYFSAAGEFRSSSRTPAGFSTSNGLVTDRTGALYLKRPVTAPREGEIIGRMGLVRVKADGSLGDSLAPPDLPVQRDVYIAERNEKGNQARSSSSANYAPNYHWAWHPEGFFLAAHGGNYQIVIARPGVKPRAIVRTLPGVPVPEEERSEEHEGVLRNMRQTDPNWSWNGPPLPRTKAPLMGLFAARDGRIWVRMALPSERIPDAELTPPRDPAWPVSHFRTPVAYEVFAADGTFLGRVTFPRRTTLIESDANQVWALSRDENDLPAIVRFRVDPAFR
jgi:hypothetical protein